MERDDRKRRGGDQQVRPIPKPPFPVRKVFVRVPPDPTEEEIDALADLMFDELWGKD